MDEFLEGVVRDIENKICEYEDSPVMTMGVYEARSMNDDTIDNYRFIKNKIEFLTKLRESIIGG